MPSKDDIEGMDRASAAVFEDILAIKLRQEKETTRPLIVDRKPGTKEPGAAMGKQERRAWRAQHLGDPDFLGSLHDQLAQRQGLTPERPFSKQWFDDMAFHEKERRGELEDG